MVPLEAPYPDVYTDTFIFFLRSLCKIIWMNVHYFPNAPRTNIAFSTSRSWTWNYGVGFVSRGCKFECCYKLEGFLFYSFVFCTYFAAQLSQYKWNQWWHTVSVNIQRQASIYTFSVLRAFMAGAATQAGDADSSRAPGLTSGLQGSVNDHRGALLLVPQWRCIRSIVFYIQTKQ